MNRAVSAMRTALVNQSTLRVDAVSGLWPLPSEHSVIEGIHRDGRCVSIEWDDGIVLETWVRWKGSWDLYRSNQMWRLPMSFARVVIEVPGWTAVCFGSVAVDSYRMPDRHRHPQSGGVGPDLRRDDVDLGSVATRLFHPVRANTPIFDALGDPHVLSGSGNVDRSEVLWSLELSPFTPLNELEYDDVWLIVQAMARAVRDGHRSLSVYGRVGQPCVRCGSSITGARQGEDRRMAYWCPTCQAGDGQRLVPPTSPEASAPADVLYLNEARAARQRVRIFDDLRDFG
ncbi:MAG: putative endonuclease [Actinomycetota bacterium]